MAKIRFDILALTLTTILCVATEVQAQTTTFNTGLTIGIVSVIFVGAVPASICFIICIWAIYQGRKFNKQNQETTFIINPTQGQPQPTPVSSNPMMQNPHSYAPTSTAQEGVPPVSSVAPIHSTPFPLVSANPQMVAMAAGPHYQNDLIRQEQQQQLANHMLQPQLTAVPTAQVQTASSTTPFTNVRNPTFLSPPAYETVISPLVPRTTTIPLTSNPAYENPTAERLSGTYEELDEYYITS